MMSHPVPKGILLHIAKQINSAIEAGHSNVLSFEDIYMGIEFGTVLRTIENKIKEVAPDYQFDFSAYTQPNEKSYEAALCLSARQMMNDSRGEETRRFDIVKSGLGLFMAYLLSFMAM